MSTDTPLKRFRKARTLTQKQLSKIVGITQAALCRAENGQLDLSADVKARLAAILGASVQDLFGAQQSEAK